DHHRAPPVDDRPRGRARRARPRPCGGSRPPRRAARTEPCLPGDLRARTAGTRVRRPRGGARVRVWQPGGHLMRERDAEVHDWSWRRTARRVRTLASLAKPYKLRTSLAIITLLAATLTALAPPYLAKVAVDKGIRGNHLHLLVLIVAAFLFAGVANW